MPRLALLLLVCFQYTFCTDWFLQRSIVRVNKSAQNLKAFILAIANTCKEVFCYSFALVEIFYLSLPLKMAFTSVNDFQAALNVCSTFQDWEILIDSAQIPEVLIPMAHARLADLTLQEIELSFIFNAGYFHHRFSLRSLLFLIGSFVVSFTLVWWG